MSSVVLRNYPDDAVPAKHSDLSAAKSLGLALASFALLFGCLYHPLFTVAAFLMHAGMLLLPYGKGHVRIKWLFCCPLPAS
jgi:hypothetical protein